MGKVVTITMTREHYAALITLLEIVARSGTGQFRCLSDMFGEQDGRAIWDIGDDFEDAAKAVLIPELAGTRSYYGIRHEKTPRTSKLAWELFEAAIQSRSPVVGLSGLPLPTIEHEDASDQDEE